MLSFPPLKVKDAWMGGQMDGVWITDEWIGGWMDRQIYGWMDSWMDV